MIPFLSCFPNESNSPPTTSLSPDREEFAMQYLEHLRLGILRRPGAPLDVEDRRLLKKRG